MHDTTDCVNKLSTMLYPHLEMCEDFSRHVDYFEVSGKMILRATLIQNLRLFDDHLVDQVPKSWKIVDVDTRTLITMLGEITYMKRIYEDECGCRRHFIDEVLGIPPLVRIEASAFLWIIRKAADVSYQKTARAFNAYSGANITKQTVMRCVHKEGELLAARGPQSTKGRPVSAPVLFCEFDGFYVHLQTEHKTIPALSRRTYKEQHKTKSTEMKVWVAYAGIKKHKRIGAIHWASDAEPDGFFDECMNQLASHYETEDLDYLVSGSDAAGWCKDHGIDDRMSAKVEMVSLLDRFHINQRVMRAFSSEIDRSEYLGYLYGRDFDGFFAALALRIASEPEDERIEKRADLYSYIENNLAWLKNSSLARQIRTDIIADIPAVFGDRSFSEHLITLLENRRYKRFIATLKKIVNACSEHLKYDYECFLEDVKHAFALIELYRPTKLGTMEGTNSKVYAARLKVWGCSWSKRGALAMMRIRAAIATGEELIAPGYEAWLTDEEKRKRQDWLSRSERIPEAYGSGYEPPQGKVVLTSHMPSRYYGLLARPL